MTLQFSSKWIVNSGLISRSLSLHLFFSSVYTDLKLVGLCVQCGMDLPKADLFLVESGDLCMMGGLSRVRKITSLLKWMRNKAIFL